MQIALSEQIRAFTPDNFGLKQLPKCILFHPYSLLQMPMPLKVNKQEARLLIVLGILCLIFIIWFAVSKLIG